MTAPTRCLTSAALALAFVACGSNDRYQGLDAEGLYRIAYQEYEEEEYDNAIQTLGRLLGSFGGWVRIPDARLLLAHSHFAKEDFLTARTEYNRFVVRYPSHRDAAIGALGVCKSLAALSPHPQRDQQFTFDAMNTCRNAIVDHAGSPESREAAAIANRMRVKLARKEFENGRFYFNRKLWDAAIMYYEFVLDLYPETEFAPRALLGIYRANLEIDYQDLADEARQRLLRDYPDSDAAREIRTNGAGA